MKLDGRVVAAPMRSIRSRDMSPRGPFTRGAHVHSGRSICEENRASPAELRADARGLPRPRIALSSMRRM